MTEFTAFPKMARLNRTVVITEKIDGTNAQVLITEEGELFVGSRKRWITPSDDNFGFARWVEENREEIMELGPGRHFGEWWGSGIQRGYGLAKGEKRFSLFNTVRWCLSGDEPARIETADPRIEKYQDVLPECCGLVPVIHKGIGLSTESADDAINYLEENGSLASPGFDRPEGIVCFHLAGNVGFKRTIEKDDQPKGKS